MKERNFCEARDIFNSPWGILAKFRTEAEAAPFGKLEKMFSKKP